MYEFVIVASLKFLEFQILVYNFYLRAVDLNDNI